jgi:protein CpxP
VNFRAFLVIASLVVSGAAIAQTGGKAGQGPGRLSGGGGQGGQMRARTPEERVERLSKDLNLNADQKKKIVAIFKASATKGRSIFEDKKMTREQKMAAFGKFRDEQNKKVKAVLTKDQIKKYDTMLAKRQQRGPGGPGGQNRGSGGAKAGGTKTGSGGKG